MAIKKIRMTQEGLDALKKEYSDLINNQRKEVAEELKVARSYGDLSENAEYDAAKAKKDAIEKRIQEIEYTLDNYELVEVANTDAVSLGSTVEVERAKDKRKLTVKIVSSNQIDISDPNVKKISEESPLGKALIGSKKGDVVTAETQNGDLIEYKVKKVN